MYENTPENLKLALEQAPKKPGVYIFRSEEKFDENNILYIGKAVNLYNRSRSYFQNYERLDPRLRNMVEQAKSVEYLTVDSEVEALVLESNVIKKYKPKYNVALKDDKSYIWVKVYSHQDFPQVVLTREKKEDKAEYFGPFPATLPIRRMLKKLRKVFPYRSCSRVIELRKDKSGEEVIFSSDTKPCLYYDLGLCQAPCNTEIPQEVYRNSINSLKRFLRSEQLQLKADMRKEMDMYSKEKNYEDAARVRDQLRDLEYLTTYTRIGVDVDDSKLKESKRLGRLEGLEELFTRLGITTEIPFENIRIECYDISNIQGTNATGAMVVSKGGKMTPNLYRKFKIKTKSSPDDFAMMKEVLARRLQRLVEKQDDKLSKESSFDEYPQLIIIDGGKGQLAAALDAYERFKSKLEKKIEFIGLAKREEEVFTTKEVGKRDGTFHLIHLSRKSNALKIMQQARDEAHRFGLGYHRLLRSKGMLYSELDLIPGVGEVTKKKLFQAYGSVDKMRKLSTEEINEVVKNKSTARKIKKLLSTN